MARQPKSAPPKHKFSVEPVYICARCGNKSSVLYTGFVKGKLATICDPKKGCVPTA